MHILNETYMHYYLLMCLIGLRFFHPSMRDIVTKNKECSTSWAAVETCGQDDEGILSITEKEKVN